MSFFTQTLKNLPLVSGKHCTKSVVTTSKKPNIIFNQNFAQQKNQTAPPYRNVSKYDLFYDRKYRGPLKGVVLDWAGTTLDYGCLAPAVAFVEAFKKKKVPITVEEARLPMGAHKKDHIRKVTEIEAVRNRWKEVYGKLPTEKDVEQMFHEFVPIQEAVLAQYADLIPGTLEAVENFRKRGLKIGTTTGYLGGMMKIVIPEAKKRGYKPDHVVCAGDVPQARPAPWMCLRNAEKLGIYPMSAMVKVDDTPVGIEEGLNAGMWTIGLAASGNEVGLSEKDFKALKEDERKLRLEKAYKTLAQSGAHFVVDSIADVPHVLDVINESLARGERP